VGVGVLAPTGLLSPPQLPSDKQRMPAAKTARTIENDVRRKNMAPPGGID
jgi:hypothetical protein